MIKAVFLDPPVKGGAQLRRHLKKVGLKCGYDSWFVEAHKLPQRLIELAGKNITIVKVDGRCTLSSLKRARENTEAQRNLEI